MELSDSTEVHHTMAGVEVPGGCSRNRRAAELGESLAPGEPVAGGDRPERLTGFVPLAARAHLDPQTDPFGFVPDDGRFLDRRVVKRASRHLAFYIASLRVEEFPFPATLAQRDPSEQPAEAVPIGQLIIAFAKPDEETLVGRLHHVFRINLSQRRPIEMLPGQRDKPVYEPVAHLSPH